MAEPVDSSTVPPCRRGVARLIFRDILRECHRIGLDGGDVDLAEKGMAIQEINPRGTRP
jgi:hypothetical protein